MTQEEKARAYDEAVNKLRRFMEQGVEPLITRADVQDFFPELKESEDEKIRKWLIGYFQRNKVAEVIKTHDILAWLEKQNKPKWSEEDEKRLQSCISSLQGKGLMGGVDTMDSKWLKSLKQRLEGQR